MLLPLLSFGLHAMEAKPTTNAPLNVDEAQLKEIRIQSQLGIPGAQFDLANYYELQGSDNDLKQAIELYELAANQGLKEAQNAIGLMYDEGKGVTEDDAKAIEWYQKSADQGHAEAQFNLANMYAAGTGVEQDFKKALSLFEQSAATNTQAYYVVGVFYFNGYGVDVNKETARTWFQKAADNGDKQGMKALRTHYFKQMKMH